MPYDSVQGHVRNNASVCTSGSQHEFSTMCELKVVRDRNHCNRSRVGVADIRR